MEGLLGYYYIMRSRSRFYAEEYELEILQDTQGQVKFKLERSISGGFGSSGSIWEGVCISKNDKLIFNAKKKISWENLAVGDGREEYASDIDMSFEGIVFHKEKNDEIEIHMEDNVLHLTRISNIIQKDIFTFIYWLIRSIPEHHGLRTSMSTLVKVPNWRISTLLIKEANQIIYNEIEATELIVEYDLYIEKEEKEETEKIEMKKEHYRGRAIFGERNRILKFSLIL